MASPDLNNLIQRLRNATTPEDQLKVLQGSTAYFNGLDNESVSDLKCFNLMNNNANDESCVNIIEQCLNGNDTNQCLTVMKNANTWLTSIEHMDKARADQLLLKMGVLPNYNSFDSWVNNIKEDSIKTGLQQNENLKQFVEAVLSSKQKHRVMGGLNALPKWYLLGAQRGGANIHEQFIDNAANTYELYGGASLTSIRQANDLRRKYLEMKTELNKQQKTIDPQDDHRIMELIDSLVRSEDRVEKLNTILNNFQLVKNTAPQVISGLESSNTLSSIKKKLQEEVDKRSQKNTTLVGILGNLSVSLRDIVRQVVAEYKGSN